MQQKLSLNKALFAGIAITLLIFSIMLWMSYRQRKATSGHDGLIANSQAALYQAAKLLSYTTDIETGSRGFVLTGNPVFLEPLLNSEKKIHQQIATLKSLAKDDADKNNLIDSLLYFADKKIAFSDSSIQLRNKKGLAAATAMVATGRGKFYLDQVRQKIEQLTAAENASLTRRMQLNDEEAEKQQIKFLSVAFIVIVLLVLLLWSEKKWIEAKAEKKSSDELQFLLRQINQSNDAIYTLNNNRVITSWNKGAEKLYGYTSEEAIGTDPNALLKTVISDEEIMVRIIELNESDYWTGDLERTTKSGKNIYVSSSATCVRNESGAITGYVSVTHDITTQKKLNEQVLHLASIVEQSSEAIFSRGVDQRIISWNSGAEKLFGFNKAEVIGKTLPGLGIVKLTDEQVISIEEQIVTSGGWHAEMQFHSRKGSTFFGSVNANSIKDERGKTDSFYFIIKDITARKALEEQLRNTNEELEKKVIERTEIILKSESKYRYLFRNNPLPMWVIDDSTFEFLDINDMAVHHYGYSRSEFLSMRATDIRPKEERDKFLKSDHSRTADLNKTNRGIWQHLKKDGSIIQVEVHSHQIEFENKKAKLILANDVTEKLKSEELLASSELRYRYIIEQYPAPVVRFTPQGYFIMANSQWEQMWNDKRENAQGYNILTDEHIAKLPFRKNIEEAFAGQSSRSEAYLLDPAAIGKSGRKRWLEMLLFPIKDAGNQILEVISVNIDITDTKEAKDMLAASEQRFRLLIENSAEGITLMDKNSEVIYRSPSATRIIGEAPRRNALEFTPPEELEAFKKSFDESLSKPGIPVPYKVKYIHASGKFIWTEGVFNNLLHIDGVNAVVANYHEVTDKVQAENKLASSEKRFRTLIEQNKDVILLMDKNFNLTYRSPSAIAVNGWTDEEVKSMPAVQNIHPDDLPHAGTLIKEMMANPGKAVEVLFRNQHKNGTYRWVEGTMTNLLHDRDLESILFNFRDVTERIEAQEKLKASEEQFRYSLDNMLEGVQIVDFEWRYMYVNKALCKQGKYSKEELIGFTMMEKYPGIENTSLFKSCQRCMKERISIHLENVFEFPDKTKGFFELSIQPVPEGVFILSVDITDRKNAEENMRSSEQRFRSLIENISDAIVMNKDDSTILYQSPSVSKILGYTNEERKGTKTVDYVHPDYKQVFFDVYKKIEQSPNTPVPFQYRVRHKNGNYIWLEGLVTNLLHQPGVNAYVANYRDVTERKQLEELLKKANSVAKLGGWEVDLLKGTVYWSEVTKEIHEAADDYVPDLISGINFYKEGASRELITAVLNEGIATGKSWDVEVQIITAKNNERWVRCIGEAEFIDGKCTRVYGSFQDIDQRKKAEEKIVESEKLYRNLFTNMLNGFAYCKAIFKNGKIADYTYLSVNSEYEKLIGIDNITGKNMSDVFPGLLQSDTAYAATVESVALLGQNKQFEIFVTSVGKWFSVALYSPEKGYFVSLISNITERKQAEEKISNLNQELEEKIQVRTAQLKKSNEELEAFSYSVSHDLRAPLRAVIGYTSILQDDYGSKLDEEGKRVTDIIKGNTQKMGHLIDDLLAFSRIGKQELLKTPVNTNSLVAEVIKSVMGINHQNIQWQISDLPDVEADGRTLRQVWVNLISNAVKYSAKKAQPAIEIGSFNKGKQVVYFVKDNGAGFDEKYKQKLFKVFQRLHSTEEFEGTGIGLAIVDKIISKHGGYVWAEATLNVGASFYFSLPEYIETAEKTNS